MFKLFTKEDDEIVNKNIEEKIKAIDLNNSEPDLSQLHSDIKEIFENNNNNTTSNKKDKIYFTTNKGSVDFNIENSILFPNIYNHKEELDINNLFTIIYIFSFINKNHYPIRIVTNSQKRLLSKICNALNYFFNKNYFVIHGIYTMFNSIKDSEDENTETTNDHL